MTNRTGFTLIELAVILLLAGVLTGFSLPAIARGRDTLAVTGARGEILTALAHARAAATVHGGARVEIDTGAGTLRVIAPDGASVGSARQLARSFGVTLQSPRGVRFDITYDRLGIGRLANTTLHVRRGQASRTITVSAYGRVR